MTGLAVLLAALLMLAACSGAPEPVPELAAQDGPRGVNPEGWPDWIYLPEDLELAADGESRRPGERHRRLSAFADMARVRTVRRGIVMDPVIVGMPSSEPPNNEPFNVTFSRRAHLENEALINALLEFTEICPDRISFRAAEGRAYFGGPPVLTAEQDAQFELLQVYMAELNAPFWEDRHASDPVIVWVAQPGVIQVREGARDIPGDVFTVWLYDEYTPGLSEAVADFTGIEPRLLYFRVAED